MELDAIEVRVLGCLLEKELATPEYYPLSLNALVNACNQKTNRQPVLSLSAEEVGEALHTLKELQWVVQSDSGRVAKFYQSFSRQHNLVDRESALLGLLLLRGPQTPGELRSRAENMCPFEDLEQVATSLEALVSRSLAVLLPKQPGQKEQRYGHLLGGEPEAGSPGEEDPVVVVRRVGGNRIEVLEEKVAQLENELAQLRQAFLELKQRLGD
nr:YceH family protein [uncultured Desulfobulbus sp.]